jgi:hypothetical protein
VNPFGSYLYPRNFSRHAFGFADMLSSFMNWNAIGSKDKLSGREDQQRGTSNRNATQESQHASILRARKIKVSDVREKNRGQRSGMKLGRFPISRGSEKWGAQKKKFLLKEILT